MKSLMTLVVLSALLLVGCGPAATVAPTAIPPTAMPASRTLTVFAASSLTDAFNEIGKNFEAANPGVTVTFNFAGSQALQTQIEQGATPDVFASANKTEMDNLITG